MTNHPPYFQFYAIDFLIECNELSLEETGAYIKLLAHAWIFKSLPACNKRLSNILGVNKRTFNKIWEKGQLKTKFHKRNGRLYIKRGGSL